MKTEKIIEWIALTVAGYVAYRLLDAAREKLEKAGAAINQTADVLIAAPIATGLIRFLLPEPLNVTGAAILPDGKAISFNALNVQKTAGKEEFWFAYGGHVYQLGPRSTKGNYPTRLLK